MRLLIVTLLGFLTSPLFAQSTTTGTTGGGLGSTSSSPGGSTLTQTPTISGTSSTTTGGTTSRSGLNNSNILGQYYANPYYQGRAGATQTQAPGGFGSPLYGTSSGTTGSTSGGFPTGTGTTFGRNTSTSTGTSGTLNASQGGLTTGNNFTTTGQNPNSLTSNRNSMATEIIAPPRAIAYTATIQFKVAPPVAGRLQSELRSMLDRSSMIDNPRGIELQVDDSGNCTLKGQVRDEDQARLIEGMLRLSPGVREVRNELHFPVK